LQKRKGRPFLEVFASALQEDYRFPVLEIFAFLYAISTFTFASLASVSMGATGELTAYYLTDSILSFPLIIFVILILKNIAYGLGNDIEKGIIQTFLSYPLKRHRILSAKLLSALGVALLLFLGVQISALYVLAPDVVGPYLGTVLLTYAASLSIYFLIAGIMLLVTLILRRGGLALIFGIIFLFAFAIVSDLVIYVASAIGSSSILQVMSVFAPNIALGEYYQQSQLWTPTFTQVLLYVGASYVIVASVFFVAYLYFSRKFGL
jgi:ABC-type transport system involved in multi-copper enzyme maturation permease subunit